MYPTNKISRVFYLLVCFLPALALSGRAQSFPGFDYPDTPRTDQQDTYHGVTVPDPYRWLEAMSTHDVRAWTEAQDALARRLIETLPDHDIIRDRVEALVPTERFYPPQKRGEHYYYVYGDRDDGAYRWGLYEQPGPNDAPRLLIDARSYGEDARFATYSGTGTPSFQVSPDGKYVAFGIVRGSSRWSRWYVYDVHRRVLLSDSLDGIHSTMATVLWRPDEPGFFYAAYPLPSDPDAVQQSALEHHALYYHRLGTPQDEDDAVFSRPERPGLTFWAWLTGDGHRLVVRGNEGARYWLDVIDVWSREARATPLVHDSDAVFSLAGGAGNKLWLRTTQDAPKGRIVEVDSENPANWRTLVPENPEATLNGASFIGERFVLYYTKEAIPSVEIFDPQGRYWNAVELPYIGWLRSGFTGTPDDPQASFTLQGTGEPDSIYLLDVRSGTIERFKSPSPAFDREAYTSEQVFFTSRDGTRIPMTLMYKRTLGRDRPHPTWLYAYGANWAAVPWYALQFRAWIEMGGIYAFVNVRGGLEYGQPWRDAGSGVNKQNGIDDYLGAAQWLIDNGYTDAGKLVANGGSASGPLAAAALLQRPDLFGAGAIDYPVLDLLRYHKFAAGSTAGNWGTAEDPDEFAALHAWSPYHNVRPGTCYPPTLIAQGNEDRAAAPLHSYKFAAALQHGQACANPILLQVAWGRGHTIGGIDEIANQLTFLASVTGLDVQVEGGRTR